MKRIKDKHNLAVSSHYPILLWKQCICCKIEFKREYGWKYKSRSLKCYICPTCARTKFEAENRIMNLLSREQKVSPEYIVT